MEVRRPLVPDGQPVTMRAVGLEPVRPGPIRVHRRIRVVDAVLPVQAVGAVGVAAQSVRLGPVGTSDPALTTGIGPQIVARLVGLRGPALELVVLPLGPFDIARISLDPFGQRPLRACPVGFGSFGLGAFSG